MKSIYKNGIVLGLALFAMFFGAGNLIFPTSVGYMAGDKWLPAMLGFLATGVGLPLLGVYTVIKIGGSLTDFASKLGTGPSKIYGILIITTLALVAVSRTSATTYEMSIQPMFPSISPVIGSILFFMVTLILVFNPTGIIDRIGKILTPVLLVMLAVIISKGILSPISFPVHNESTTLFTDGFFGGYQTMDALGSVMLGGIITAALLQKNITDKKDQQKSATIAIAVAGLGLGLVYGGLLYLGSTSSSILPGGLSRTQLTIQIVEHILGNIGPVILGICVMFACLTTSVGLTATVGDFYADISNKKIPYKVTVTITCIICALIANFGVDMIVTLATPLLIAIYPVTILLIASNLFRISSNMTKGAVYGALSISIFEGLSMTEFSVQFMVDFIKTLPLSSQGFSWILPAFIGLLLGFTLDLMSKSKGIKKQKLLKA